MRYKTITGTASEGVADSVGALVTSLADTITFTASNKILVIAHCNVYGTGGGSDVGGNIQLVNASDATILEAAPSSYITGTGDNKYMLSFSHLDSPSGTSATYKIKITSTDGADPFTIYYQGRSSLTLFEVQT